MKQLLSTTLFVLLLALGGQELQAQFYVGVQAGVTLPQGFYADSRMSDNEWMFAEGHQLKAGAGRGWGVGLDLSYAIPAFPSLEVVFQGNYLQSGASRDVREYYDIIYKNRYSQCSNYLMELPQFRNVSLQLGVRYCYPMGGIDLYGEALAGVNLRFISDWKLLYTRNEWMPVEEMEYPEYDNIDIRSYGNATTFAYSLGVGFLFKKTVTVGANFMMLGSSPLTWDRYTATRYNLYGDIVEHEDHQHVDYTPLNPTMVMVKIGYRLKPFHTKHVQDW